jgi:hypothetical protein
MNVSGIWYSELGSKMTVKVNKGQIDGTYETAVGGAQGQYVLTGRTDIDPVKDSSLNIGWVVMWEGQQGNTDSLTSWSGQLQELDGQEVITTFWLLTIETKPDANWKSTLIGQDVFKRTRPTDESISQALRLRNSSHPL